jgi:deoxycytidine triphosphate deaminase
VSGILVHQEILKLCGLAPTGQKDDVGEEGPVRPCRRGNVRSASYDLRLGEWFHSSDAPFDRKDGVSGLEVKSLSPTTNEHIVIPPNQAVVVSSKEEVLMDADMVGHLTLKQDVLLEGLIMASQSQIDAGYNGRIYALLYNLTDGEVCLQLGKSILRFELVRLEKKTDRPYDGDYQDASLAESLRRPIRSSLADMRREVELRGKEVEKATKDLSNTRLWGGVIALVLAAAAIVIPFATGFVGDVYEAKDGVANLEREVVPDRQVEALKDEVASMREALEAQERKIARLARR